ncbi:hypothetical protein [Methylobacterium goesingense]|uniref:DUF695 domain-containing protein n=1 Tax=Methylobacterium goesingense TaxID=243690 RepID=A0ABV2LBZ3_9HYPH|nr:hypothetical protein [Methylobacterium goesingense]GJD73863.1 hypothetical protein CFIICLFH_2093 [Methylobacterium goesingense]
MAFVCTVSQGAFRVQVFQAGIAGVAIISIGHDDAEPLNYSAAVGLDVLPGGLSELYFHIVEADGATNGEHIYWSGKDTGFIADPQDRETILVSILTGLKGLLSMIGPEEFIWITYDERVPKKALLKFQAIRQAVERAGYAVTSSRASVGRKAWKAKRLPSAAIDIGEAQANPIDLRD